MSLPVGLGLWRLLTWALSPLARPYLRQRASRGKEDWIRVNERLGLSGLPRPEGRLVWVHGASVGESLSALPLIENLLAAGNSSVLVTSGTVTSAAMMSQRLPAGAVHQFVPLDTPGAVARFLDHWKPDAGLFVESDLWPNLILAAKARGRETGAGQCPHLRRFGRTLGLGAEERAALLSAFDMVLAQDEEDRRALSASWGAQGRGGGQSQGRCAAAAGG
jgi:3-deoxy-D-manno-octulosonic-acid transferase